MNNPAKIGQHLKNLPNSQLVAMELCTIRSIEIVLPFFLFAP